MKVRYLIFFQYFKSEKNSAVVSFVRYKINVIVIDGINLIFFFFFFIEMLLHC